MTNEQKLEFAKEVIRKAGKGPRAVFQTIGGELLDLPEGTTSYSQMMRRESGALRGVYNRKATPDMILEDLK